MKQKKLPLSRIMVVHYLKLVFRSLLFLAAAAVYILNRMRGSRQYFGGYESNPVLMGIIWVVFIIEMALRFFPSKLESMGCQKQFSRNYVPVNPPEGRIVVQSGIVTFAVASAWVALNAIFGVLYYAGVIDRGILLLIALAYSVCDVICILFFCPFQTWFMKNKCCGTCRIYNWDYAMMFTPLVYIPNVYSWSLLGLALALLIKWEILLHRHPERFSEAHNRQLTCAMCPEKLCHHKTQLQGFLKKGSFRRIGDSIHWVYESKRKRRKA